jgi:hypothetical protein
MLRRTSMSTVKITDGPFLVSCCSVAAASMMHHDAAATAAAAVCHMTTTPCGLTRAVRNLSGRTRRGRTS